MWNLFRTKRFLPLFIVQFLEAINDNLLKYAFIILITYTLNYSTSEVNSINAIAGGIFILPYFILSAFSGQLADKYNKATLIRWVKVFEIAAMSIGGFGFYFQSTPILLFTLFLLGIHSTLFGPIKYSILPQHLQDNELVAGNALIEGGTFVAILAGTMLGSQLFPLKFGPEIVTVLGVAFAIIGLLTAFQIPTAPPADETIKLNPNIFSSTYQIIKKTKANRRVFMAILGISWFWLVAACYMTLFPAFVKDVLGGTPAVFNFFIILFSVGIAVGALISNKVQHGEISARYVPLAAIFMTVFMLLLYFASHIYTLMHSNLSGHAIGLGSFLSSATAWFVILMTFFISICGGIYTVPLYAMVQHLSDKKECSRTIAANNILNALFMVIMSIFVAIWMQLFELSIESIFLILALLNFVVSIYICRLLPEDLFKSLAERVLKFFYRVEVKGIDHYKDINEKALIIANHTSFLDALLLAVFLPKKPIFAINTFIAERWWVKLFLPLVDAYPMDPTNPMSLKGLINEIKKGKHCVIFPEGRLTMTGALMKVYQGPGVIADKAEAPILPIRIDGAMYTPFTRLKGKVKVRLFPKITLHILPPREFKLDKHLSQREKRKLASQQLYDLMTEVMFESSQSHKPLLQALFEAKKTHGAKVKIAEDISRHPINYRQVLQKSLLFGAHIKSFSQRHENIALLLPNTNATLISFFATQAAMCTPIMLNFSSGTKNLLSACHTAKAQHLITSRVFLEQAELVESVNAIQKAGLTIHYLEDIPSLLTKSKKAKGILCYYFSPIFLKCYKRHINAESKAVILFTSGSEGTPKGVVLSHKNLQANRYQLTAKIDFNKSDRIFNALPLFHSFGLTIGTLVPVFSGVPVFFYPSPLHFKIVPELIYDTNSTILLGTGTFLNGYAQHAHPYDFYNVRYIFAGAEKLKDDTRKLYAEKFGLRIFEGYGATETAPALSMNTPMQNKVGSVGKLLPMIEHKLESIDGIDQGGRLFVKGPNIMSGYLLEDKPGILQPLKDNWYDTGDIVRIDEQGYVFILDRAKRFAKIAGEMISLTQVENELTNLWPSYLHAVINLPDQKKGERLVLITNYPNADRNQMREHFKAVGLNELAIAKEIIIEHDIPLLGTGKINYVELKNKFNSIE
ncbi:acyl-[ACP]--phospholipid O-acyltransferase [Thiotrichales bacterium 19S3-7]|nr:acyl-[ACP]--phospholipid O-acyltransferase [Thiotrichales bacterium 19S3-7]MCF6801947.1 acyl-[ACP]--phospholipid O-acyltransferase [Thiotrichales bacterium 19S3-11]